MTQGGRQGRKRGRRRRGGREEEGEKEIADTQLMQAEGGAVSSTCSIRKPNTKRNEDIAGSEQGRERRDLQQRTEDTECRANAGIEREEELRRGKVVKVEANDEGGWSGGRGTLALKLHVSHKRVI